MYSRYSGQIPPDTRIPGNYSGNAFRQQTQAAPSDPLPKAGLTGDRHSQAKGMSTLESSAFSPAHSADIPGFYRQAPRPIPEQSRSPHISYSPLAGTMNAEPGMPSSERSNSQKETPDCDPQETERKTKRKDKAERKDDENEKESCDICRESRSNAEKLPDKSSFHWFPAGDDLLLLGLLILLIQSKGNDELALIIAMLLIIH